MDPPGPEHFLGHRRASYSSHGKDDVVLTIRKRGRYYHCRGTVRVGKKVRYVQEHSTGFGERAAAETYKARLEYETQQELLYGLAGRKKQLKFADAGEIYLNRPDGLHRMDVWRLGELNEVLGSYTLDDVAEGWSVFKQVRCQNLAPATVERFRATLQAALNYACQEWGFDAPKLPKVKFKNERVKWLTKPQREQLLVAYPPHVRPIMLTLCFQGCRTQEALQLRWPHLELGAGRMYFDRTKNGDPRSVQMHPRVNAAVREIWTSRDMPTEGHVFLNRLGKPYSDTRDYKYPGGNPLRKAHETACRRAGVTGFRIHDWRHHWACWCVMEGVDFETIKRMGGWKSLRMVERYAAVSTEHMDAAMARIS